MKQLIIVITILLHFNFNLSAQYVSNTPPKVSNCLYLNLEEKQVILNLDTYFEISSYCKLINDKKQSICHKPFVKLGDVIGNYNLIKHSFRGNDIVVTYIYSLHDSITTTDVFLRDDEVHRIVKAVVGKNNIIEYFNK